MEFYKYQAAGNDFIMINETDRHNGLIEEQLRWMCDRRFGVGADGVIYLRSSETADFEMIYHNSDGKIASMCGNGGRAIVRFASDLGLIKDVCRFIAVDGEHQASVRSDNIRLKMQNVEIPKDIKRDLIETGSPHFVSEVSLLDEYDVVREGRELRFDPRFSPGGCNVNFIEEVSQTEIQQRTYERGVEDETLACGTGAVAGAVYHAVNHGFEQSEIQVRMRGGKLTVSLTRRGNRFVNVWLNGPAEKVFKGNIDFNEISPKLGVSQKL